MSLAIWDYTTTAALYKFTGIIPQERVYTYIL